MKLLKLLKSIPFVSVVTARLKKSARGRAAIRRIRVLLRIDRPAPRVPGERATVWIRPASEEQRQEFQMLRVEWRDQGATPHLVDRARSLARNSIAWGVLIPSTWLLYCAVLLEAGDRETAAQLLRTYAQKHGLAGISEVLTVAQLARELGLRTGEIDQAAATADRLLSRDASAALAALVEGRTVAVVGNGPGALGQGRGAEIDAHDVVIRFNNFPEGFEADYGARTDVWVRGAHPDVRDRFDLERFDLVVWEMDFARNFLEDRSHREILYRDTLFSPEKVAYLGTETKRTLRAASGLLLPTSGAQILWALHQARGGLEGVDVYGFSSIEGSGEHGHYFDRLGDMGRRHDVEGEGAFLRGLLSGAPAPTAASGAVVFSCAYREYDPSRGRTGGPAGVLATQRLALGDAHAGHELRYLFDDSRKEELREQLSARLRGVRGKIADIILGGEHIRTHPDILRAIASGRDVLLVCHELGSAFGAYQLGVPYVIVYHQQGSTLQEMRSIGQDPTPHEITVATRLEELICGSAQQMLFPSIGARETFKATADPALVERVRFADTALYNTVSAVDHGGDDAGRAALLAGLARKLSLPEKDADTDVFLSVGDWNEDKGLDRVPALLSEHARRSGRKVVWVGIGSAIDRARYAGIKAQADGWPLEARLIGERMTHDRLLALLDYADYYVMLHRNSIFDLATLEAMRAGKPLILSPVGGNPEVDLAGNVLFADEAGFGEVCDELARRDRRAWGDQNRVVFEEHFALAHFAERYRAMLDEQLAAIAGETRS